MTQRMNIVDISLEDTSLSGVELYLSLMIIQISVHYMYCRFFWDVFAI